MSRQGDTSRTASSPHSAIPTSGTSKKLFGFRLGWNRNPPKPPVRRRTVSTSALTAEPLKPEPSPTTYYNAAAVVMNMPPVIKQESEEMCLSEFAMRYQNNLPQQVVITKGVYSEDTMDIDISSSERLNIHFIRHRESVSVVSVCVCMKLYVVYMYAVC